MSTKTSGPKSEKGMENYLRLLLENRNLVDSVRTFEDRGLLTSNKGLVVGMSNGAEFQIQIVQSERADR